MKNIQIRKLTVSDTEQMIKLMETRDDLDRKSAEERMGFLNWIAFNNPSATNGEPTYYVAENRGRIVAYHGRMPTEFTINGKRKKGYYVHDLYVDPESRKKGQGFWLSRKLDKTIQDESDSFICLFGMTPFNQQMQKLRRYHELYVDSFIKVLHPEEALSEFVKNKIVVKILSPILLILIKIIEPILFLINSGQAPIVKIDRFDSRFDDFYKKVAPKLGISSFKSSRFLNWRYIDGPAKRDMIFATEVNHQITGYVIVGLAPYRKFPVGVVKDIVADPEDSKTISALLSTAIKYLKSQKVYSIRAILSDKRFGKLFKRFLFLPVAEKKALFIGNLEKCDTEKEELSDINNWHLTLGESDIYMLSVGLPTLQ